jgi:hypothetical protein
MSDSVDKTAAGATRGFFGSLSFILLMVGVEMLTDKSGVQLGLGVFLLILGVLCAYAAFFWESAKRVLSAEAQDAIGRFSQSRITWFGMLFLVVQTLVFSRFVEERRWPFSYPTDPQVYRDMDSAKQELNDQKRLTGQEKESADKWRFVKELKDASSSGICHYQLVTTANARSVREFWDELLQHGEWIGDGNAPSNSAVIQPGITLRIPGENSFCASAFQRAATDFYSNPPTKIATNQANTCGKDCVVIEMNY